jgi:type II secretory pathway component PulK
MKKILKSESGQALITLLFFVVIGVTIISATVIILFINNLAATAVQQGVSAYYLAESGAEDGYLRLLRNPNLTPFTNLSVITGQTVSLSISSSGNNRTITSVATVSNNTVRKIQVQTVYNNGAFTISSWKEIN